MPRGTPGTRVLTTEAEHPLAAAVARGEAWIAQSQTPDDLVRACSLLRRQAASLYEDGLRSEVLTRTVARWNDAVVGRLLGMHAAALADLDWCWLALGSEGREEQTVHTDQDNALLFRAANPDAVRQRLLPVLRLINEQLDRCGYTLCPGEVMASNPRWCLHFTEWQQTFANWVDTGDPAALLHGAIFFDFRGIAGNGELARELRDWLLAYIRPRRLFLKQLAAFSVANAPPLWPWRRLRTRRDADVRVFDVKINGVTLFVDAARVFALDGAVTQTRTSARFLDSVRLPSERRDREAWVAAYRSLQDLRVRYQFDCLARAQPPGNRIPLERISRFDERVVVVALREAQRMQASLRLRYQL